MHRIIYCIVSIINSVFLFIILFIAMICIAKADGSVYNIFHRLAQKMVLIPRTEDQLFIRVAFFGSKWVLKTKVHCNCFPSTEECNMFATYSGPRSFIFDHLVHWNYIKYSSIYKIQLLLSLLLYISLALIELESLYNKLK